MKGIAVGWIGILSILIIAVFVLYWEGLTDNFTKAIVDETRDSITLMTFTGNVKKSFDSSLQLIAKRAAFDELNAYSDWTYSTPTSSDLENGLRRGIDIYYRDSFAGKRSISFERDNLFITEKCGQNGLIESNCFVLAGTKGITANSDDFTSKARIKNEILVTIDSSFFKLAFISRNLFEKENYRADQARISGSILKGQQFDVRKKDGAPQFGCTLTAEEDGVCKGIGGACSIPIKNWISAAFRCGLDSQDGTSGGGDEIAVLNKMKDVLKEYYPNVEWELSKPSSSLSVKITDKSCDGKGEWCLVPIVTGEQKIEKGGKTIPYTYLYAEIATTP